MQLKSVFRVLTMLVLSIVMLVVVAFVAPTSPVQGHELSRLTNGSLIDEVNSSPHAGFVQVGITDTTSTTATVELTSTANISATATFTKPTLTPSPTEEATITASLTTEPTDSEVPVVPSPPASKEKTGVFSDLIARLDDRSLIPLGFIFVILVTALTLILITVLRKVKRKSSPQRVEGSTAPLLPKVTPTSERAFLQLKDDPEITFLLAIDDIRIGRSPDNTIVITQDMPGAETVSRYHARLYRLEQWILEDLGSTNGVYVNGQRTGRNYLRNGWDIGIGGVIFTFHTGKMEV